MSRRIQYQIQAKPVLPPTAVTWGWFEPFFDPVRPKFVTHSVIAEPVVQQYDFAPLESWSYQWSEPVRVPRRNTLYDEAQPVVQLYDFAPLESWSYQWSEPVRVPRRNTLYDEAQPVVQQYDFAPLESWFSRLSEPVRVLLRNTLYDEAQPIPQPPVPATTGSWFEPLSEPIRVLRRNTLYLDSVLAPPQIAPAVPPMGWVPWSDPVRTLPRTAFFDFTTFVNLSFITPATVLVPRIPVYQPYRPTPKDDYSWDFFNPCVTPQFMPTTYFWTVRAPQPIDQFWSNPPPSLPPPPATVAQWFHGWDPPVRVPPRTTEFSPAAGPPPVVPLVNVTFQLQTLERKDAWSMAFTESVNAFTARVGIVELPPPPAAVGVVEGPLPAGITGVIET